MKIKRYIGLTALVFSLTINAQTINFEDASQYKSIGVYDSWVDSAFRTNELSGNVKVITNELNEANEVIGITPNASGKMLAFQRSRLASNLYGARIDLNTPIQLTPENQYVHVLLYKEKTGRVMLIGLGRRTERPHQAETEQFNEVYAKEVTTGQWNDLVFPIKGAQGVEVHALVVVPDCESTHNLDSDFACYIDEIVVDNNPAPRFSSETYPVNFEKTLALEREDRATNSVSFNSPSGGNQTLQTNQSTTKKIYYELVDNAFLAKAGETITPAIAYSGTWMHSYIYIDYGQDGKFDFNAVNGSYAGTDVVNFSYYDGKTYSGSTGNNQSFNPGQFTIPSNLENGFYRIRYKVDWNNIDAGGCVEDNNHIKNNGGIIVDTRINIHSDQVRIYRATGESGAGLNGDILKADGSDFTTENIPFGQAYTIKSEPAPGFRLSHVVLRHGYNTDGDSIVGGTKQYSEVIIPASSFVNDSYTIPAEYVDGDVSLLPYFVSVSNETYAVRFSEAENGSFEIKKNGVPITNGEEVQDGTTLTVVVTPNEGYELDAITVNGSKISGNSFTVVGETTVVVTFREIPVVLNYCTYDRNAIKYHLSSLALTNVIGDGTVSGFSTSNTHPVYNDCTSNIIEVQAGQTIGITCNYSNQWMHGYLYIDYNKDGAFADENPTTGYEPFNVGSTGIPAEGSELVSYSYYGVNDGYNGQFVITGYDSKGTPQTTNGNCKRGSGINNGEMPDFTIPSSTRAGEYRARFNVAWNQIDPCSERFSASNEPNTTEITNRIDQVGGYMIDFTLKIVADPSAIGEVDENITLYYANDKIYTNIESEILVYDMAGNLVKQAKFAPIDVAGLASGVYVVHVNGKTLKFVK